MVDLQRYRTNSGERNFIERIKARNFFEAVLSIEVMIWSLFECWNCTVRLYVNPFQLFLSHALGKWNFLWNGKKPMWFRSKKKKNDKQCIENYRPVSLLLICSKIFERLLFNKLYKFFNENDILSSYQWGFRSSESCINQLLSITYEIHQTFDNDLEVRGVFYRKHLIKFGMKD